MYAANLAPWDTRGVSMREIQGFLLEIYGISAVTDAVIDEVLERRQRPLEPMYPVAFFDALRVKIGGTRRTLVQQPSRYAVLQVHAAISVSYVGRLEQTSIEDGRCFGWQ